MGRYNTMLIFLYRPSPQIPEPSLAAARKCFNAAAFNIQMHRDQIRTESVDLTWIFTQSLFMVLNTLLWTISFPEIRKEHPREEVDIYLLKAQEGILLASSRWPGVEAAMELYSHFIYACLKAYDHNGPSLRPRYSISQESTPELSSPDTSQKLTPSPSTVASSYDASPNHGSDATLLAAVPEGQHYPQINQVYPSSSKEREKTVLTTDNVQYEMPQQAPNTMSAAYQSTPFNPDSIYNPLPMAMPTLQDYYLDPPPQTQASEYMPHFDYGHIISALGDPYFQDTNTPLFQQLHAQSLSREQQRELMVHLETSRGLYDVDGIR